MSRRKRNERHELLPEEVIIKACHGDSSAIGAVIANKTNYVKKVICSYADFYELDRETLPVDDLEQIVWIKFLTTRLDMMRNFK